MSILSRNHLDNSDIEISHVCIALPFLVKKKYLYRIII